MEQVLLLAKNAKGLSSVTDLVSNALTLPDLFVFGELLYLPSVQEVSIPPYKAPRGRRRVSSVKEPSRICPLACRARPLCLWKLERLHRSHPFSPLRIRDAQMCSASPETYPELSDRQKLKLKQLTLISMAQSRQVCICTSFFSRRWHRQVLLYSELKNALDFDSTRSLEDFLINGCFYYRILKGHVLCGTDALHKTS